MNEFEPDSDQPVISQIACATNSDRDILIALAEVIRDVYIATAREAEMNQLTDRVQ